MPLPLRFPQATIAVSGTTSGTIDCDGDTLCGVFLPSTFDGTALSFTVCDTAGGTYVPLHSDGAALSLTVAASTYVALDPSVFAGVRHVKFVASAQSTTDTILTAVIRPVG